MTRILFLGFLIVLILQTACSSSVSPTSIEGVGNTSTQPVPSRTFNLPVPEPGTFLPINLDGVEKVYLVRNGVEIPVTNVDIARNGKNIHVILDDRAIWIRLK